MNNQEKINLLKTNYLFQNLGDDQIEQILTIHKEVKIPKGDFLMREKEVGEDIYLLITGQVGVIKDQQQIASLNPGEVIGEMSLIDQSPRSASIIALEDSSLIKIPLAKLPSFPQIVQNISKQLTKRLRNTNESTVKALQAELEGAKMRVEMGAFLFRILIVLCGWIFASTFVIKYEGIVKNSSFISIPAIVLIFFISVSQVLKSAYPRSFYGLTLHNWKKYSLEAVLYSIPILIISTFFKIWLIHNVPAFQNDTLYSTNPILLLSGLIYVLFTPLQEFLARGVVQTCVKFSLYGKHTTFWSIIISNLVFAALHAFLSPIFAIVSFAGGLLWGFLYAKQRSLVGCCVSHALIGGYSLAALSLGAIFRGH